MQHDHQSIRLDRGRADRLSEIEGATGYVVPGVEVQVVDEDDAELPANSDGVLRIRAPWLGRPFPPERPDAHPGLRDGWFYPGDRGRKRADGLLILGGRASDIINAGGLKIAPEVIEDMLLKHPNIAEAAAFPVMSEDGIEEIGVAIVARAPVSEQHISDWCAQRNVALARVFLVESLPRTPLGKIRRDDIRRRLTQ